MTRLLHDVAISGMKVGIVNYGIGNVTSVAGAVEALGAVPMLTPDPGALAAADCLILPGVGAFADGMKRLNDRGLIGPLSRLVEQGKPLLGICLGAQLLCDESEEFGLHAGLGWIPGRVRRFDDANIRVPHVGWDELQQSRASPLWTDIPSDALFYYTHSYVIEAKDPNAVIGTCDYGSLFAAAIQKNNVFGIQPHPEKSQMHGLRVLENFLRFSRPCSASA